MSRARVAVLIVATCLGMVAGQASAQLFNGAVTWDLLPGVMVNLATDLRRRLRVWKSPRLDQLEAVAEGGSKAILLPPPSVLTARRES